ncbi:MAG: tRNA (adenosine(37)-N6)-threonylcarbamoyltransferase complex dimerization subunit type 1 TsaB [Paludibacter sp.]|nr:tRNA (adenosine(37)-N6)-threonylcarbamoyltransferase complex dimerization subunit type 1 TsaB [Paludibacter sp.]
MLLNIETSTSICSVALSEGEKLLFSVEDTQGQNHAALLSVFVEKALEFGKQTGGKIDAIAASAGPGSYTGLRIGVSTAKGLCFGFDVPLIAIDTLQVINAAAKRKIDVFEKNALLCPMIDARRAEVFCALYRNDGTVFGEIRAEIITENSFADILENNIIYFFGNGSNKCVPLLQHHNCRFIDNVFPLAENMITLANEKFQQKQFADAAYFEPFYLKEFQATKAKKILL